MKKSISLVLLLALFTVAFSPISFVALAEVSTTATSNIIYAGPSSTNYYSIGNVFDEAITAFWREGDYIYIRYIITGTPYYKCGYVYYTSVKNKNVPYENFIKIKRVTTVAQNVYASWEYRNSHTIIGSIFNNEEISVLKTINDMSFIEYKVTGTAKLKRGWVPTNTLRDVTTTSIKGAEEAIWWAKNKLGSRDYDGYCLMFVGQAYRYAGVSLGGSYGTAKECANAKTKYVSFNAPRGTLVFFDYITNGRNLGHVGISLGDGTFIHATTGKGVIISTLDGYNNNNYLGWSYPSN